MWHHIFVRNKMIENNGLMLKSGSSLLPFRVQWVTCSVSWMDVARCQSRSRIELRHRWGVEHKQCQCCDQMPVTTPSMPNHNGSFTRFYSDNQSPSYIITCSNYKAFCNVSVVFNVDLIHGRLLDCFKSTGYVALSDKIAMDDER
jgi:hypothetical protein